MLNSLEVVKYLVDKGSYLYSVTFSNETTLHFACESNSLEIIQYIVSQGLEINSETLENETPLHLACLNNSLEVVKFLVENGANVNAENSENETPLHLACQQDDSIEMIKYLISKGADFEKKTNQNETLLHLVCAYQKSVEFIKYLIEKGADVNAKDQSNKTPLYYACNSNSFEIIKYLVEKGADINSRTILNETPLYSACKQLDTFEIVEYLVSKGADLNIKKENYISPLSIAIFDKKISLTQYLLMNDANILDLPHTLIQKEIVDLFPQIYSISEDMNKLFKSNEFSDLQIESNDLFKFNVHQLILLTRFNNDKSILQKFINNCKTKSKIEVENVLNFIYTGFPNFDLIQETLIEISKTNLKKPTLLFFNMKSDKITEEQKQRKERKKGYHLIKEFFKEIEIDSNWIKEKKGRKGIIKDLSKLYQENETKDFTIIVKEKGIKVHKLILIIRSELFKGMFLSVKDSSNQVHDYSGKSFETIQQLIYFLYHDEFEETKLTKENIHEFEDLKDYYQLNLNSIIDLILFNLIQKINF
ncbi:protein fem-1 [Anaeramoeba ignava]|uniref:Protein fem-1 n=1 Tax=Anaeramoeba ignava TaxID=1746090 RepID=A0A9Q0L8J1_ANAIG|nr:protein fem-1 [Anaeramoeba ignava]